MLTPAERLEILNDWFSWSGGNLPQNPQHVLEYMATSYCLNYSDEAATEYLMTEILQD